MTQMLSKGPSIRAENLAVAIQGAYGPIVGGKDLAKLLGYSSGQAFRQALSRQTLPVPVFGIPHRRGKFAFTEDVVAWLTSLMDLSEDAVMNK